jgi:hypothetical protein
VLVGFGKGGGKVQRLPLDQVLVFASLPDQIQQVKRDEDALFVVAIYIAHI